MSNYMSDKAVERLMRLIPKEHQDEAFEIIDAEIEDAMESQCDNCEQRMPDEPRYNEGYL